MEASARTVVSPQRLSERNMLHFLCGAVLGAGNGTRKNIPACAHEQQNNRTATGLRLPFHASAKVMDLDFNVLDIERLITEVEESPALYN